ncbi:MAG: UDP-N-acetylglucosamine 4,6-dehydratase (inverting) [Pirellulaceae bacterium]
MFSFENKTVMITGGTGSFGQKCGQMLLAMGVKKLILFSRDEQKHVNLSRDMFPPAKYPQVRYFIGDVRNLDRLKLAMRGVDIVIHAAAMKHVDMAEYNPQECIATNIGGAENVIRAAIECGVERVVALSTDKAASPINLYGATKLCSDKLFVAANSLAGEDGPRFSVVRYGNVLGSNGSVVPFFLQQRKRGVLPITDPEMTRFIITLEQGVQLVFTALEWMHGGEVFVPKIPSTTVRDIALAVAPDCETKIVGIRPGEKLHECMIPADEARQTIEFREHFIIQPVVRWWSSETPVYPEEGDPCPTGFSYSSDNNTEWLDPETLTDLVVENCDCPGIELLHSRNGKQPCPIRIDGGPINPTESPNVNTMAGY